MVYTIVDMPSYKYSLKLTCKINKLIPFIIGNNLYIYNNIY